MNLFIIMIIGSFCSTISTYLDKLIVSSGISKKTYFFFECLFIIPFAIFTMSFDKIRFDFSIIPILLLFLAMIFRYYKQQSIVGILKYLEPHEVTTYMSLSILLAYIIDCIIKIKTFSLISVISIILIIYGIFSFSKVKLSLKDLKKDLIIRIITDLGIGYVAFYILKYWSNSLYILLLNIILVLVNVKNKNIDFKINKKILVIIFIQQIFNFSLIYSANYLSSSAVIYSQMIKPITLIITTLSAFLLRIKNKPNMKELINIMIVFLGLVLLSLN